MRPKRFQRTRRRRKYFGSTENLLFYICSNSILRIRYTYFTKHTFVGLVRGRFWNQEVRADLFNISVGKANLVLDIIFGGSVFLAELAKEGEDPLRPLQRGINSWFLETVIL